MLLMTWKAAAAAGGVVLTSFSWAAAAAGPGPAAMSEPTRSPASAPASALGVEEPDLPEAQDLRPAVSRPGQHQGSVGRVRTEPAGGCGLAEPPARLLTGEASGIDQLRGADRARGYAFCEVAPSGAPPISMPEPDGHARQEPSEPPLTSPR